MRLFEFVDGSEDLDAKQTSQKQQKIRPSVSKIAKHPMPKK